MPSRASHEGRGWLDALSKGRCGFTYTSAFAAGKTEGCCTVRRAGPSSEASELPQGQKHVPIARFQT